MTNACRRQCHAQVTDGGRNANNTSAPGRISPHDSLLIFDYRWLQIGSFNFELYTGASLFEWQNTTIDRCTLVTANEACPPYKTGIVS